MPIGRAEALKRGLLLLQRVSSFFAFLLIPFLGGNDLPLYFLTIDRFWIETSFILSIIVALFAQYLAGYDWISALDDFVLLFLRWFLCA